MRISVVIFFLLAATAPAWACAPDEKCAPRPVCLNSEGSIAGLCDEIPRSTADRTVPASTSPYGTIDISESPAVAIAARAPGVRSHEDDVMLGNVCSSDAECGHGNRCRKGKSEVGVCDIRDP